jgi:glycine cleavage system H protein
MNVVGLDFPDALYYQVEDQVWAREEADGSVSVGITALGIRLSGEVFMCRPKRVGSEVERARSVAVVELAKSIVSVRSPLAGRVRAVNESLEHAPQQVHRDPYGSGWIARLQPADWARDRALLLHGPSVAAAMLEHARLHRATD